METLSELFRVGDADVSLWLHTRRDPSAAEWESGIGPVQKLLSQRRNDRTEIRSLVFSDGGAPNALQRKQMFELSPDTRGAVITISLNNPIKRGIATAISWAMPRFRFFAPAQAKGAFEHLDLLGHVDEVWARVLELQARLPAIETVVRSAAALGFPEPIRKSAVRG